MLRRIGFGVGIAVALCNLPLGKADDATKSRLAAAGDASKYDADAVIVLDETDVTVGPSGIGAATSRKVIKVLRDAGIRGQSVQRFEYDPTTNTLEIQAVRVYRADGSVEEVPIADAPRQPEPQWGIYWGSQQVLVSVPRLAVGDAVETIAVKTGFNVAYLGDPPKGAGGGGPALEPPMPGHWYDEVHWSAGLPIIEKRYTVRMPKDKPLQYEVYNGALRSSVTFAGEQIVYSFEKRDIPPFKHEANMVSRSDVDTKLVLATLADWKTKSRWFFERNQPAFEVDDEIRATVRQVVANCPTDDAKITALNHWVAENIRYIGTSRGACEGYTTHPARETFHDRGGVCKDKAGLLVAMLREAGFESYIVMTQAGSEVMAIPADQFNHAVTSIRLKDGSFRLLDPTWMPKSRENWSSAEQLQHVVYGTPEGVDLARSPYSPPEENWIKWTGESALAPDGRLDGRFHFEAIGAPETALRRALAGRRLEDRPALLEETLARRLASNATLAELRLMDPVDFSGPIDGDVRYGADRYALGGDGRRFARLPLMHQLLGETALGDLSGTNGLDQRTWPLRLRSTRRLVIEETLRLPEGWKPISLPAAKQIEGPAAAFSFEIEQAGRELRYRCQLDVKKHRVPTAEYANYKQVIDALDELTRRMIACDVSLSSAKAGTEAH